MMKDKPDMQKSTAYRQETNNYSELSPLWLKKKKKSELVTFTQEHDRLIKKKLIFSVLLSRSFITVVALVPFFVYLTFKKSAYPVFCVWNTDLVKPN